MRSSSFVLALAAAVGLCGCPSKGSSPTAAPPPPTTADPAAVQPSAASQPGAAIPTQPSEAPTSQPAAEAGNDPAMASPHKKSAPKPAQTEVHGLKNISGVQYVNAACTAEAPCKCKGSLYYGDNALAQIGITKEALSKEGAWCVMGDFDANGYADLAVLAASWKPDGPAADVRVLLFDDVGLRATPPLPKRMKSLARTSVDGRHVLVEPAAGQKYYFAYLEAGRFEMKKR